MDHKHSPASLGTLPLDPPSIDTQSTLPAQPSSSGLFRNSSLDQTALEGLCLKRLEDNFKTSPLHQGKFEVTRVKVLGEDQQGGCSWTFEVDVRLRHKAAREQRCRLGGLKGTAEIPETQQQGQSHGIIQFRPLEFRVDARTMDLARRVHGDIVPRMRDLGLLESADRIQVVWSERILDCVSAANVMQSIGGDMSRRLRLMRDLAHFFAQSWRSAERRRVFPCLGFRLNGGMKCRGKVGSTIGERLTWLEKRLPPERLKDFAGEVRERFGLGGLDGLPVVLTHGDLIPSNILVNGNSGGIRGVIDWAEAEMLPFGVALYGVDMLLGNLVENKGFVWHPRADELRAAFWDHLRRDIPALRRHRLLQQVMLARHIGILLWFGIAWDGGRIDRVVGPVEDHERVMYLRAFLGEGLGY